MKRSEIEAGKAYGWAQTNNWDAVEGQLVRAVAVDGEIWHHPEGYGPSNRALTTVDYQGKTYEVRGQRGEKGQGAVGVLVAIGDGEAMRLKVVRTQELRGSWDDCHEVQVAAQARIRARREEQDAQRARDSRRRPLIYDELESRGLIGDRDDNKYAFGGSITIRLSHLEQLLGIEAAS